MRRTRNDRNSSPVNRDPPPGPAVDARSDGGPGFDVQPPGDRHFRHPGDVLRLGMWGGLVVVAGVVGWRAGPSTGGVAGDLARIGARVPAAVRELLLAVAQVGAVCVPVVVIGVLVVGARWRRLGVGVVAVGAGVGVFAVLDVVVDFPGRMPGAVASEAWIVWARSRSPVYLAGVAAALAVGKPWLSRSWRRGGDVALAALVVVLAVAGAAGLVELALAVAVGAAAGCAVLVGFGAPNRRPAPLAVAAALGAAGFDVSGLVLERAEGGRSQLYRVDSAGGRRAQVKVYARDSRNADVLYRCYRALRLRDAGDDWSLLSLEHAVEHEALLLMLAGRAGVSCPEVEVMTALPDGSMLLGLRFVDGPRLDTLRAEEIGDDLLDAVWAEVGVMHGAKLAHRSLRAANILVDAGRPVVIDFSFGRASAEPRLLAVDRAELLTSLAVLVGPDRAIASAGRVIGLVALATAEPFLQSLALSAATAKQASKSLLKELRSGIAAEEPVPLERLARVRLRTLFTIVTLAGAFYVLLPQLANVDDSFAALRSASWAWLLVAVAMSLATYVAAAICVWGAVPVRLPILPNIEAQMASSFVNRVTPANVGGMALNIRFLRKAGVEPGEAVAAVGLNSLAGGIVHILLLVVFFALAGQGQASGFNIPSESKLLIAIAAVLAVAGIASATHRFRRLVRTHVLKFVKQAASSIARLARSPVKLAMLFGGSAGVSLAYIGALAAAVAALHGNIRFTQVGAVYLGASVVSAVAPTPGGLGALEAALVAGFTGVGMDPGVAVAAVLSYRLATYWLPILPGWVGLHRLQKANLL